MYLKLLSITLLALSLPTLTAADDPRNQVIAIVSQIQRADYEGDRAKLKKCYDDLTPFTGDAALASRVRYWRGFDLWRRAINGFNDSVDAGELEQDLKQAVSEFKEAMAKDPAFADAKIGMISCLGYLAYLKRSDQAAVQELIGQMSPLVKEAKQMAPNNPRLFWVLGPILWYQAQQSGAGQEKVMENYQKGLEACSNMETKDPLKPSWGKPELLMNLAYTYLNNKPPDVDAAERNARSALEIVPYWHYTRDILLPQILAAKATAM